MPPSTRKAASRKRKAPLSDETIVNSDDEADQTVSAGPSSAPANAAQALPSPPADRPTSTALNGQSGSPARQPSEQQSATNEQDNQANSPMETDHLTSEQVVQEIKKRKKRRRQSTPEEDRNHEIDITTTTIGTLADKRRVGKKSKLEQRMEEIDWKAVKKRRKEEEAEAIELAMKPLDQHQRPLDLIPQTSNGQGDEQHQQQDDQDQPEMEHTGPRLRFVNGQMVVEEESLNLSRNANHGPTGELRQIEDTDVTRRITSHSYINAARRDPVERVRRSNKADPWTEDETDAFYEALRGFGTDFDIISKMFPGKTRNHVKRKFVREEKCNEERVRRALISESMPMDMNVFLLASNRTMEDYKDPNLIEAELQLAREEQKNELEREQQERDEKAKRKREKAQEKTKSKQDAPGKKKREKKKKDAAPGKENGDEPDANSVQPAKKTRKPRAKKGDKAPARNTDGNDGEGAENPTEDAEEPADPGDDENEELEPLEEPEMPEEEPIDEYDEDMENEIEYTDDGGEEYD